MHYKSKVYIMWLVLALAYVIVQFHRVSFAVIVDYVVVDFNIEKAWITGFLGGMYGVTYLIMQIPSGLLADSWGPRKTVFAGMIVAGIGTVLFIATDVIFFAFLGRFFIGMGVSVVLVPTMKFQSNWFKASQFATLTGIIVLLGNMGKLLGTSPLAYMVSIYEWKHIFFILGVITVIIALLTLVIVKDSPDSHEKGKDGNLEADQNQNKNIGNIKRNLLKSIKNRHIWFLLIVGFGMAGPLLAFAGTWSVNYLMHIYDFSRIHASNYLMVMTIGTGVGAFLTGYLSDYFRVRKKPLMILLMSNILAWIVVLAWNGGQPPSFFLYILFFIVGYCLSGIALILSLAKELSEPEYSGTSIGVVNMGPFAGMAFFQPLQGWLLDLRWTGMIDELGNKIFPLEAFRLVFVVSLVVFIISFYFAFKIKESSALKS